MRTVGAEVQIRLAQSGDAEAIAAVLLRSFEEYMSAYTEAAFATTTPTSNQIAARMSEGPIWLALDAQKAVGTISVAPREQGLYVRSMAVVPEARGKGVGDLLLSQVESFAREHGYKRLFLSTTPFLARAIRLYERWGFTQTGDGPHDLFGTPLFTMVKDLP
jgi:GNAT superfamily N-acetyltransferase